MAEELSEYTVSVFNGEDGEDYLLWTLIMKRSLSGKDLLEAITDLEVDPKG